MQSPARAQTPAAAAPTPNSNSTAKSSAARHGSNQSPSRQAHSAATRRSHQSSSAAPAQQPGVLHLPQPRAARANTATTGTAGKRQPAKANKKQQRVDPPTEAASPRKGPRSRKALAASTGHSQAPPDHERHDSIDDDDDDDHTPRHTPAAHAATTTTSTATPNRAKATRSRGRNSRQTSPPLEPPNASPTEPSMQVSSAHSTTFDALSNTPYTLSADNSALTPAPASTGSSDEWDMPVTDGTARIKQALTWQQQSLGRSNSTASSKRSQRLAGNKDNSSAAATTTTTTTSRPVDVSKKSRASRHDTFSDNHDRSVPAPMSNQASALTWQQELLQQSDSSAAARLSTSPQKGISPAKLRRQQQRDEETFGMGALDLSASHDVFANNKATPRRASNRASGHQSAPRPRPSSGTGYHSSGATSTPSKQPAEERYAGPTFHNSPLPSSLPTPSFMLRRKALESNA